MVEVEYKFSTTDAEKVESQLLRLGAQLTKSRTYELSVMYDNSSGLMQETDGRIRVRQSGETVEFCYKKPITRVGVKQEIEHQVEVSDRDQLVKILEAMEFRPTTSYERYRTEYDYKKTKVTIDEYPFEIFVEIEGDQDAIEEVATGLGFDLSANLTESCDTLFTKWRSERGLGFASHMTFENYDK